MSETPDWERVILELYENQQRELNVSLGVGGEAEADRHHSLAADMDIERRDLEKAIDFMNAAGLVDARTRGDSFHITPKGFEVAHELRMLEHQEDQEDKRAKRQQKVNMGVGYLTVGLLVVNLFSPMIIAFGLDAFSFTILLIALDFIAVIIVLNHLRNSGLLTSEIIE